MSLILRTMATYDAKTCGYFKANIDIVSTTQPLDAVGDPLQAVATA
jgi:hypothetical protein